MKEVCPQQSVQEDHCLSGFLLWGIHLRPGILELTPEACERFNEDNPDRSDVIYRSCAGCRPLAEMPLLYRQPTRVLEDAAGDNDSQVSVESAAWGEFRGVVRADHLEQLGWSLGMASRKFRRPFDHVAFFRTLVQQALRDSSED